MSAEAPKTETTPREPVPESNTIRVRVPHRLSYEQLREHFSDCGAISRLRYLKFKGVVFVQLADIEAAKKAIELHNGKTWKVTPAFSKEKKELEWRVDAGFARPPSAKSGASRAPAEKKVNISDVEVAVLHLPTVVEEADIKQIFEGFEIKGIKIAKKKRQGVETCHAFVTFPSHEVQEKAIKDVNGTTVESATITVEARRFYSRPQRSGNRRRAGPGRRRNGPARRRNGGASGAAGAKKPAAAAAPNESIFVQVPRFTTHEQVKEKLLKDFKDYKLFLRSRRLHSTPLCFVTFSTTEEAKKCIDSVNDTKWKFTPGDAEKGKEIEWTIRASFARPRRSKETKAETPK